MPANHTVVIPQTGSDALSIFNSVVKNEFSVLIILGDDALAKNVQAIADVLANQVYHGIVRKVLWIKNVSLMETELKKLITDSGTFNNPLNSCIALAVNPDNDLKDVILRSEPIIDTFRIEDAFAEAS